MQLNSETQCKNRAETRSSDIASDSNFTNTLMRAVVCHGAWYVLSRGAVETARTKCLT